MGSYCCTCGIVAAVVTSATLFVPIYETRTAKEILNAQNHQSPPWKIVITVTRLVYLYRLELMKTT